MTKNMIINGHHVDDIIPDVALKVKNLSKVYVCSIGKVVSLRNVRSSIDKEEFVSVVGRPIGRQFDG